MAFETPWMRKGEEREEVRRQKEHHVCRSEGEEKLAGVWKLEGSEESGRTLIENLCTVWVLSSAPELGDCHRESARGGGRCGDEEKTVGSRYAL